MEHSEAAEMMAVERYLLEEMSPEDRDAFEDHFFGCPECAAGVRDGEAMRAAVRGEAERRAVRPRRWHPAWLATAALFVLVLAGIPALQNVRLRRDLEASRAPGVVDSYSLLGAGSRGGEQLTIKSASRPFTIDFDVPPEADASAYVVRVRDRAGRERLTARLSADAARDTQHLFFPARSLEPGIYSLEIQADPPRSPASRWTFDVRP